MGGETGLFQSLGAATEKALWPTAVLTRGTFSWSISPERSVCTFRDGWSLRVCLGYSIFSHMNHVRYIFIWPIPCPLVKIQYGG